MFLAKQPALEEPMTSERNAFPAKELVFFGASMIPSISHAMSVENEMESGIVVVPGFTPTNSNCQQKIFL